MTSGWRYNIRLFDEREKKDWEPQLRKITDAEYVGAQWNMNTAKKNPPECFDEAQ